MTRRWTLAAALALTALGCSTPAKNAPPAGMSWVPTSDEAVPFEQARRACKDIAIAETGKATPGSVPDGALGGAYVDCMRNRGWAVFEGGR